MPGVVLLVGVATAYDVAALLRGWPTISAGVRVLRSTPPGRMAVAAAAAALIVHFIEEG